MNGSFENLYIHVPFCRKKCAYCAFYSEPDAKESDIFLYLDKICSELKRNSDRLQNLHTVYFGGGTPSLLPPRAWDRLRDAFEKHVSLCPNAEISMEANPSTVTDELCSATAGLINRVSMGVQSFSPALRKAAGRAADTSGETAARAVECWNAHGIFNLGIDLMYVLPGETLSDWEKDLEQALALKIRHLSAYSLTIEEGTPLAASGYTPDNNLSDAMWRLAGEFLAAHGMPRYEISNYAASSFEARHNQNIWHGETYLGIGPAASSFDGTDRWTEQPSLAEWLAGRQPERDVIPRGERLREIFMMGLRTVRGWKRSEFAACSGGVDFTTFPELERLQEEGFLIIEGEVCRPSERGLAFWNEIAMALL